MIVIILFEVFKCFYSTQFYSNMDLLLSPIFSVLSAPDLKLKRPTWVRQPTANEMLFLVLVSYFLVTGGIIYDVIVEPPSMGSTTDEHGHSRPVAFMQYRINGQYIMEGKV